MGSPITTIVTATYNKAEFLAEAAESVFRQTRADWCWWLILDGPDEPTRRLAGKLADQDPRVTVFHESTTEEQRTREYRPAVLINNYFPRIDTRYFCWLSDDDLLEPDALEVLVDALRTHPEFDVAYGACEVVTQAGSDWRHKNWIRAPANLGKGTNRRPDCVIDGGQVLQTKRSFDALDGYRLPTDFAEAHHVDGVYLNRLARDFTFFAVNRKVMTKRCTYLSTHKKGRA